MTRSGAVIGGVLAVALLGVAPAATSGELAEWNQAKVTALAEELSQATGALRTALRQQPPPSRGQPGSRSFWTLRDDVQTLVSASARLHRALVEGQGHEETFPTYRRLLATARSAEREVRRVALVEPVPSRISATADVIRKLRPFYEAEPSL